MFGDRSLGGIAPHSQAGRAHTRSLIQALSATAATEQCPEATPCAECDQLRPVMFAMQPGPDGAPWSLCSRCYSTARPAPATARPDAGNARSGHDSATGGTSAGPGVQHELWLHDRPGPGASSTATNPDRPGIEPDPTAATTRTRT
jgi:hypothetical protein